MTDNEIMQALKRCYASGRDCTYCPCTSNIDCVQLEKYALDLIDRLQADKEALIAGQETLQKALAKKNAKIEALQMDNAQLQSDIINANQNLDHINGLYEAEKTRAEKAKEKCIYFVKRVNEARAETDRVTEIAAGWKEAAYKYADSIDNIKAEAIKECLDKVAVFCAESGLFHCEADEMLLFNYLDSLKMEAMLKANGMVGESDV